MKIIKCHISSFGLYNNVDFEFNDSMNVFCLPNGNGKSTLADFIKSMLYGMKSTLKKATNLTEREHYLPNSNSIYGGSLVIEFNNNEYTINREFDKVTASKDKLVIYNDKGSILYELGGHKIDKYFAVGEYFIGIDKDAFERCNFIYSNDLRFEANDSIKTKINGLIIDNSKDYSYEEVIEGIDADLKNNREGTNDFGKTLHDKNTKLRIRNGELKSKLDEIHQYEKDLVEIKKEFIRINDEFNKISFKKEDIIRKEGLGVLLQRYKEETLVLDGIYKDITTIKNKYNNAILSREELETLKNIGYSIELKKKELTKHIDNFDKHSFENNYKSLIEDNLFNNNVYLDLLGKKMNIDNLNNLKTKIDYFDETLFLSLDKKFKDRDYCLKIESKYSRYVELLKTKENMNHQEDDNKIHDSEMCEKLIYELNELGQKQNDLFSKIKKLNSFKNIFIIIITFGLYFIVLNNKKRAFNNEIASNKNIILNKQIELNNIFSKYGVSGLTNESKLSKLNAILYAGNNDEGNLSSANEINDLKSYLVTSFRDFGYLNMDLELSYKQFSEEHLLYLQMYNKKEINDKSVKDINTEILENEKGMNLILNKYFDKNLSIEKKMELLEEFTNKYKIYDNENKAIMNLSTEISSLKDLIEEILRKHDLDAKNYDINKLIDDMNQLLNSESIYNERLLNNEKLKTDKNLDSLYEDGEIEINKEDINKQIELLRETKKQIELNITNKETEISNKVLYQSEIEENKEEIEKNNQQIDIISKTKNIIENAELDLVNKYLGPIKDKFISYCSSIKKDIKYNVLIDFNYNVKFEINGKIFTIDNLSDGEKTIVLFALRLAIINSIFGENKTFLILDDPFVHLDEENFKYITNVIKRFTANMQILYFTCHQSRQLDC